MSRADAPVAVLGGTFNPVHHGHLRSALELVERLGLAELRLMPCGIPPHREAPACAAGHRAAMVELAVVSEPKLHCDRRELQRTGRSFTYDSLAQLRTELGADRSLGLVVGGDAIAAITTWYRWAELLDLAHILVIARPGWRLPADGEVASWLEENRLPAPGALPERPAGGILVEELRQFPIASTEIRELLAAGRSPRYLLPETVLDYIHEHGLYAGTDRCEPGVN